MAQTQDRSLAMTRDRAARSRLCFLNRMQRRRVRCMTRSKLPRCCMTVRGIKRAPIALMFDEKRGVLKRLTLNTAFVVGFVGAACVLIGMRAGEYHADGDPWLEVSAV